MDHPVDFVAWADEQAAILRRLNETRVNDVDALDLERLAEDVQEMADVKRDHLRSALSRIVEHLLKLVHSPDVDLRRGWRVSVAEHRSRAETLLDDSGTLRAEVLPSMVPRAWSTGRKLAVKGLQIYGHDAVDVPADCPWTLDQILDDAFEPANRHGLV
ncbi:MAG: DUF29 domain-containing protein [Rhodospirillales bacterium]|jgi:hypothetical protein